MQYKLNDSIHTDVESFRNANATLTEALDKIGQVLETLDTDVWQGASKESAVSVMLILKEYHEKILSVAVDNLDAMVVLENKASEYMQSGNMPSIWK